MFIENEKYYNIEEFEKYNLKAIFTKKNAGNMSDYCPNNSENNITGLSQKENRKNILLELGIKNKTIIQSYQKHTTNIIDIKNDEDIHDYDGIDGFITNRNDVVLITYYADCLPIYIYDINKKIIGLAHSGWKGTLNGILENLISKMVEDYNSNINDIIVAFGIGIQKENYEVQEDFFDKFLEKFSLNLISKSFIYDVDINKYYYDNIMLNYYLAIQLGIKKENIILSKIDTYTADLHSYRRDGVNSGRSAAIICKL